MTDPNGPAFEAALAGLRQGFDKDPIAIGCGGSIGFVGPLADLFGGAPALLLGIEDPAIERPRAERKPARRRLQETDGLAGEFVRKPRQSSSESDQELRRRFHRRDTESTEKTRVLNSPCSLCLRGSIVSMTETRPNPDELLARVQAEENAAPRGKLKIFFGYAAGVGKTYAMLEAAQRARADGIDVVVGYVEPHGRHDTESLLKDLEQLPPKQVPYRGIVLREFDLDAALARKPRLILVDELAHTNAEGLRHAKRWQDVDELLAAGIDVYTTLNVQHVESLNDVIAQITGVVVSETLPDSVLERADEMELVDLTPDELIDRLREGKVYVPQQAARALEHFFQRGNLVALRELSLRQVAQRLQKDVQAERQQRAAAVALADERTTARLRRPEPDQRQIDPHRQAHGGGFRRRLARRRRRITGRHRIQDCDSVSCSTCDWPSVWARRRTRSSAKTSRKPCSISPARAT